MKDVPFFEDALGNAYNRAISSTWNGADHWLFDDTPPVRRPILRKDKRGQVNDANRPNRNSIDHLRNGLRESATIDDVISNLTLGFWVHMTDRSIRTPARSAASASTIRDQRHLPHFSRGRPTPSLRTK